MNIKAVLHDNKFNAPVYIARIKGIEEKQAEKIINKFYKMGYLFDGGFLDPISPCNWLRLKKNDISVQMDAGNYYERINLTFHRFVNK